MPERKPPLRELYFDERGRLWVELSVSTGLEREADVYGPAGPLLAHHTWPASVQLDPPASVQGTPHTESSGMSSGSSGSCGSVFAERMASSGPEPRRPPRKLNSDCKRGAF